MSERCAAFVFVAHRRTLMTMAFPRSFVQDNGSSPAPIQSAFDTAVHLLEAGRASLLVRDASEPVLVVAASVGIDASLIPSIRVPIGQGIAGLVVERGLTLFGELDHQTFVSTPVVTEHGVEGALNVTNRAGGRQYTPEHMGLATSAAAHIGHLIQYGRYAARDPVSGLPNRRAFEEALDREMALSRRTGSSFAILFLDLDDLKEINDRLGHAKGDQVIRAIGDILQRIMRPYDFASRYGGDEFALLLPGTNESDTGIGARIANAFEGLSRDLAVHIAVSVGLAHWPVDGADREHLLATADARMYQHKRAKRHRSNLDDSA